MPYGKEIVLDVYNCDASLFTRDELRRFFVEICDLINMERADLHFWDYEDPDEKADAPDHLSGTSAIQFITTSNIVVHTLDKLGRVYINVFSCKDFDSLVVWDFVETFFRGEVINIEEIARL